jgi:hypothetical protein
VRAALRNGDSAQRTRTGPEEGAEEAAAVEGDVEDAGAAARPRVDEDGAWRARGARRRRGYFAADQGPDPGPAPAARLPASLN